MSKTLLKRLEDLEQARDVADDPNRIKIVEVMYSDEAGRSWLGEVVDQVTHRTLTPDELQAYALENGLTLEPT
jgi:hypothetical protein